MLRRSGRRASLGLLVSFALAACGGDTTTPAQTSGLILEPVASGLDAPLFMTAPAGDTARLFVVEQTGRIRIVKNGTLLAAPFLNLSTIVSCCSERGLLGLAFHPQYATNGFFYVNYTNTAGDTRVVRYHVSANPDSADPASASQVLAQSQPYSNHNGGMLAFGNDGMLYIGLGDGGSGGDPQGNGQNPNTLLGKILRLNVDGTAPYEIPPGNPFIGQAGHRAEIWSLGLRNPWRFSFDRATHEMYIGDVGQGSIEEIDIEPAATGGRNYGWVTMEGTTCYPSGGTNCNMNGLTLPAFQYTHSDGCSVTGGYVYRGQRIPTLAGTYFYSDYCSGWVRSFRWNGSGVADHVEWTGLAPGGNVSSFGEDAAGEIYVISHTGGTLSRIGPELPSP